MPPRGAISVSGRVLAPHSWITEDSRSEAEVIQSSRQKVFLIGSKPVNNQYLQAFFISSLSLNIKEYQTSGELFDELFPAPRLNPQRSIQFIESQQFSLFFLTSFEWIEKDSNLRPDKMNEE